MNDLQDVYQLLQTLPQQVPSVQQQSAAAVNIQYVHHKTSDFTVEPKKKRQKYSRKACANCRKAHSACADERPCYRCKRKGIPCDLDDVIIPVDEYDNCNNNNNNHQHHHQHNHGVQQQQQLQKRPRSILESPGVPFLIQTPQQQQQQLPITPGLNNNNFSMESMNSVASNGVDDFLNFLDDDNEDESSSGGSSQNSPDIISALHVQQQQQQQQQQQSISPQNFNQQFSVHHHQQHISSPQQQQQHISPQPSPQQQTVIQDPLLYNAITMTLQQQQQQIEQQQAQYRAMIMQQEQLMKQLEAQKRLIEQSNEENQALKQLLVKSIPSQQQQQQQNHQQQFLQLHQQQQYEVASLLRTPSPSVFSSLNQNIVWNNNEQVHHFHNVLHKQQNSMPIFWNSPMQFSKKAVSYWDRRNFVLIGCNSNFASLLNHDLGALQNNFSLWDLCPKGPKSAFLGQFFTLISSAKARTVTLKTILCNKHEQKVLMKITFHLEESFFWCECEQTEYIDDEVYLDDKRVMDKTYELSAKEIVQIQGPDDPCLMKKHNIMNRLFTCLMAHRREGTLVRDDLECQPMDEFPELQC